MELMKEAIEFKPTDKKMWLKYKTAKRTLDVLIEHCDNDGDTFVGIKAIAARLLTCNQTVMNHFEILRELNILIIEKVGRKSIKSISFGSKDSSSDGSKDSSKDSSSDGSSDGSSTLEAKEVIKEKEYNSTVSSDDERIHQAFEIIWEDHREFRKKHNNDKHGSKAKAKKNFKAAFKAISKGYDIETDEIFDYLDAYVHSKRDGQYTQYLQNILIVSDILEEIE